MELLQCLATVAHDARIAATLSYVHIAVRVVKRNGRRGVSESTVARFEYAEHWPKDPEAMVAAYAEATGDDPLDLWQRAVEMCQAKHRPRARPPPG